MPSSPRTPKIRWKKWVEVAGEMSVVFVGLAVVLVALLPTWFTGASEHLIGPDRFLPNSDLSNTLFAVQRTLLGESGCETRLFALPLGASVCSDIPNPLVVSWMGKLASIVGVAYAINWGALILLSLNGLAVYGLFRIRRLGRAVALLGALLTILSPNLISEVAFGRSVSAFWAPSFFGAGLLIELILGRVKKTAGLVALPLLAIGCAVTPITVLLLAPWVVVEVLLVKGRALTQWRTLWPVLLWGAVAVLVMVPIALDQAYASPLRLSSGGWWESHLGAGSVCATGAEVPSLYPWNEGRVDPLVGAGSPLWIIFVMGLMGFQPDRARWLAPAAVAGLFVILGLGPCMGGATPWSWSPIGWVSETFSVVKLIPIWRIWAAAGLLMTLAYCTGLSRLLETASKPWTIVLWGFTAIHGIQAAVWVQRHTEQNIVEWPVHSGLEYLEEERLLLDLPVVTERGSIHRHIAEIPVARFNPEIHDWDAWHGAVHEQDFELLKAADALQRDQEWRTLLAGFQREKAAGLRRILFFHEEASLSRREEWRAFLGEIGAVLEAQSEEIEVYRLPGIAGSPVDPAQ